MLAIRQFHTPFLGAVTGRQRGEARRIQTDIEMMYAANTVPAPLQIVREHSWYSSIIHGRSFIYYFSKSGRRDGSLPTQERKPPAQRPGISVLQVQNLCIVYRVQAPATSARPIDYEVGRADK